MDIAGKGPSYNLGDMQLIGDFEKRRKLTGKGEISYFSIEKMTNLWSDGVVFSKKFFLYCKNVLFVLLLDIITKTLI